MALPSSHRTAPQPARALDDPHQIALDVGWLSLGVSYARRVGSSPWSLGVGIWGSWEPPNNLDRSVFEPIGISAFARYRAAPWLHVDVGPTLARYLWADDCSDCTGTIAGIRALALVGHRFVFVGPDVIVGRVSDECNGAELGILWGGQLRLVLGWGT